MIRNAKQYINTFTSLTTETALVFMEVPHNCRTGALLGREMGAYLLVVICLFIFYSVLGWGQFRCGVAVYDDP